MGRLAYVWFLILLLENGFLSPGVRPCFFSKTCIWKCFNHQGLRGRWAHVCFFVFENVLITRVFGGRLAHVCFLNLYLKMFLSPGWLKSEWQMCVSWKLRLAFVDNKDKLFSLSVCLKSFGRATASLETLVTITKDYGRSCSAVNLLENWLHVYDSMWWVHV